MSGFFSFLCRFHAVSATAVCAEAGLPSTWAFGYLSRIASYYIIS